MISPINNNSTTKTQTSILYINDFHGKLPNLERLYTASNAFDRFETSADKLKLSSGDDGLGEDPKISSVVSKLLDMIGITKRQTGNHEYDINPTIHAEIAKNAKYKELGAINIHPKTGSCLNEVLISSAIEEKNGHKYGIVGIGPSDMMDRLKAGISRDDLRVDDLNTTIKNLQDEVNKLKQQGIDKIILLSHSGYHNDVKIAKETSGIDVILGGHSHNLLTDIKLNKNLFYNKEGEPVVITQAGKDGEHFGILNLEFNEKGIITQAQNNVIETSKFNRTLPTKYTIENIIGKPEHIGHINSAPPAPKNRLIENNPHANFMTDAIRHELGTDIAIVNAGNIRGAFEKGDIDSRMVTEITPFKNKMTVIKVNEKELVDAIKVGCKAMLTPDHKPGLIIPSGLKYTLTKKGELINLTFITKDNKEIPIDINNPNENKYYTMALDDFISKGGDGFSSLNKINEALAIYDFDKDVLICDYIKKQNKPIDIIDDKRIRII